MITLDLRVVPRGSSSLTGPIQLSFGGPFTASGAGRPPESDFTISLAAQGHRGALQVISAGGNGYITVSGQSYRMPASSFKSLESGFGSLGASGGSSRSTSRAGSGNPLSKLGIKPLDWLVDPRIVGSATLDGVRTTRIRATVDARALLSDLSRLLGKARALGVTGSATALPHSISPSAQRSIARALGSPSFELWTGSSDGVIRRLLLSATIPVTGQTRRLLGGMRSATIALEFQYSHVNQPQTIRAPASTRPYSVFRAQVASVLQQITGGTGLGSTGTTGTSTGAGQGYAHCITAAGGDVAKMQRCAKLLGSG